MQFRRSISASRYSYRDLFGLIKERDEEISALFDPHTRSRAVVQLIGLCDWWLLSEAELSGLSVELLAKVKASVHHFGNSKLIPKGTAMCGRINLSEGFPLPTISFPG